MQAKVERTIVERLYVFSEAWNVSCFWAKEFPSRKEPKLKNRIWADETISCSESRFPGQDCKVSKLWSWTHSYRSTSFDWRDPFLCSVGCFCTISDRVFALSFSLNLLKMPGPGRRKQDGCTNRAVVSMMIISRWLSIACWPSRSHVIRSFRYQAGRVRFVRLYHGLLCGMWLCVSEQIPRRRYPCSGDFKSLLCGTQWQDLKKCLVVVTLCSRFVCTVYKFQHRANSSMCHVVRRKKHVLHFITPLGTTTK